MVLPPAGSRLVCGRASLAILLAAAAVVVATLPVGGPSATGDPLTVTAYAETHVYANCWTGRIMGYTTYFHSLVRGGTPPYRYAWSFDDRGPSNLATPVEAYSVPADHLVSLVVTDRMGVTSATTLPFRPYLPSCPPRLDPTGN